MTLPRRAPGRADGRTSRVGLAPGPDPPAIPSPSAAPAADRDPDPDHGRAEEMTRLVARAQGGDSEAFGIIYDRYVDLVFRYVYYRVGSRALAEDLVSETFLRAWRRIGTFTWQGRDLSAWLVTIARNLVVDHHKSSRYRLEIPTADIVGSAPEQLVEGPEAAVLTGLTNATLVAAVRRLRPEQQECLMLRFLQGMSVRETALALGKNEGAIKALQYRALRSLARLLPPGTLEEMSSPN